MPSPPQATYKSDKGHEDERLSINQLAFCGQSGVVVVGGSSGQVLVAGLEGQESPILPQEITMVALMGGSVDADSGGSLTLTSDYTGWWERVG